MEAQTPKPRQPFKLSGMADIKHLNVRKEGPEDDKVMALDVKLEFSKIDRELCNYFDEALINFLWIPTTESFIARNAFMKPVGYLNTVHNAIIEMAGHRFVGSEAKKFELSPRDGGVMDVVCSITIYPNSDAVSDLADLIQEGCRVSIEGQPDLFDKAEEPKPNAQPEQSVESDDDLLKAAFKVCVENKRASVSLVQRHLKIGYNRAARLLETLEQLGMVSPMASNGQRTITK